MAKEENKIQVVYLNETIQNIGLQGLKTLSIRDIPGLSFELMGDSAVKYFISGKPSGIIYHPKSVVFEK